MDRTEERRPRSGFLKLCKKRTSVLGTSEVEAKVLQFVCGMPKNLQGVTGRQVMEIFVDEDYLDVPGVKLADACKQLLDSKTTAKAGHGPSPWLVGHGYVHCARKGALNVSDLHKMWWAKFH